ncbi:MAG: Spy/CpxP family protein refolding chaperone [Bacteroidales bacterium]
MGLKYKIIMGVLAALVIILGAALVTHIVFTDRQQKAVISSNSVPAGMGRGMIIRELGMSGEQIQKYDSLRISFFENTSSLRDSISALNSQIAGLLSSSRPNQQEVLALVKQVGNRENRYKQLLVKHIFDLHQICTPEQREKLGKIYPQLINPGQGMGRGMMYRHRWGRQQRAQ